MIVVAIIEILAAIAYTNLVHFKMRTKAGEGTLTLVRLGSSEGGYFSEPGTYIAMAPEPFTTGGVTTPQEPRLAPPSATGCRAPRSSR